MDFGWFRIQRFTETDLNDILHNRINTAFYANAVVDTKVLSDCWFIYLTDTVEIQDRDYFPFDDIGKVTVRYTAFSEPIAEVLRRLVLFDWQEDRARLSSIAKGQVTGLEDRLWIGLEIPFVLMVDNDLLTRPRIAPDTSKLQRKDTGFGDEPERWINLSEKETEDCKVFIQRIDDMFSNLMPLPKDWQFFNTALGFLMKAFFSEGLEQLLWHITTLEALLGESGTGVTERLGNRIGTILGRTKRERQRIKKEFKDLYDFRSDLVHGNIFKKQVYVGHLHNARNLARKVVLWFLNYLHMIQEAMGRGQVIDTMPTRKDILMTIDLDKRSRHRLSQLVEALSSEFPCIQDWLE